MSCSKDQGCLYIANKIYPNHKDEIDGSVGNITNGIDEIVNVLGELYIPQDYLGTKVKEKVDEICKDISIDNEEITLAGRKIDSFISEKITEHKIHYNLWREEQERILKKNQASIKAVE